MRRFRALVIGSVVAFVTFGWPTHGIATPVPATLDKAIPLVGTVAPDSHLDIPVALPWRANTVGVSFSSPDPDAEGVSAAIQPFVDGEWAAWSELRIESEDAPDGAEARRASKRVSSDPVWVGLAEAVRVRLDVAEHAERIGAVKLQIINTAGNAREANIAVRAARAIKRLLTATAFRSAPAEAHPPRPDIVTRSGWGADESWRSSGPGVASSLKMAFVHHTVNGNGYSRSEAPALVRGIYRYHTKTRGYSDIAYNFLVDRYGAIYEGRHGGITQPVIGAHVKGFNTKTVGVALIGTFTSAKPTKRMWSGLKKILAYKLDLHHLKPTSSTTMVSGGNNTYRKGERVRLRRIAGHRHGSSTACPGAQVVERLSWLRKKVRDYGDPKVWSPKVSTKTVRRDGDGINEYTKLTAKFSEDVSWVATIRDGAGTVVHRRSGTGDRVGTYFNGRTPENVRLPTGRYVWQIDVRRLSSGHAGRSAKGVVYVISGHPLGTPLSDATSPYLRDDDSLPADAVVHRSHFPDRDPIRTGPWERWWYGIGSSLALRVGTLLEDPEGARYIWSSGALRPFVADEAGGTFAALGYDETAVIRVGHDYVDSLPAGAPVSDVTVHPDGTVVWDPTNHNIVWVLDGGLRRPISRLSLRARYRWRDVVDATPADMALPEGLPVPLRVGTVLRPTDGGRPWLIDTDGKKRRFIRWSLFWRMGYRNSMLTWAFEDELDAIPTGSTYG